MATTRKLKVAGALKILRRQLGNNAAIRDNGAQYVMSAEKREAARAALGRHRMEKPLSPDINDLNEWPADATIGDFRKARDAYIGQLATWQKKEKSLREMIMTHRYTVGTAGSLFFTVKGEADTLEEALRKAGIEV